MKRKKRWKIKVLIWFRDEWPLFVGLFGVFMILAIPMYIQYNNKNKPQEEQMRTEVFTYKGHQYIKFKGHDMLGTGSVVHDPDCKCQVKRDSISTCISTQ